MNPVSSGAGGEVFQQSAKVVPTDEVVRLWRGIRQSGWPNRETVVDSLVWPEGVIVSGILLHEMIQVVFAEGDEMVENFLLDRLNDPFAVGVQIRTVDGEFDRLAAGRLENAVELFRELRVAVVNEVPGRTSHQVLDLHAGISRLLSDPGRVGVGVPREIQICRVSM